MIKKGKVFKLKLHQQYKTKYGTIDSDNCRSVYVNIKTWFMPTFESENWYGEVSRMRGQIKNKIFNNINRDIFSEKFILDFDVRDNRVMCDKYSFMIISFNLYTYEPINVKDKEVSNNIKLITNEIIDYLNNKPNYIFNLNKKEVVY